MNFHEVGRAIRYSQDSADLRISTLCLQHYYITMTHRTVSLTRVLPKTYKMEYRPANFGTVLHAIVTQNHYIILHEVYQTADTNPDEISLDEQLRHRDRVGAETFSDFLLHFSAHEHVSLHVLDQMGPQYLPDLEAPLVRVSDYAHGCRVQHDFARFFFLPRLKRKRVQILLRRDWKKSNRKKKIHK